MLSGGDLCVGSAGKPGLKDLPIYHLAALGCARGAKTTMPSSWSWSFTLLDWRLDYGRRSTWLCRVQVCRSRG
jgi:hypothetical protein